MSGVARAILVANQKGGVGKSTTVAAVAEMIAAAGKRGRRVLVVDGDPQANVTVEDLGIEGDRGSRWLRRCSSVLRWCRCATFVRIWT